MTSKWILIVVVIGFCAALMGAAPGNAADGAKDKPAVTATAAKEQVKAEAPTKAYTAEQISQQQVAVWCLQDRIVWLQDQLYKAQKTCELGQKRLKEMAGNQKAVEGKK